MSFWKKGQDPWDIKPDARKRQSAISGVQEEADPTPTMGERLRDLLKKQTSGEAEQSAPEAAPLPCPWCGVPMETVYLLGGRGALRWTRQKPLPVVGTLLAETFLVSEEGFWGTNKICCLCAACGKLTVDLPRETGFLDSAGGRDDL